MSSKLAVSHCSLRLLAYFYKAVKEVNSLTSKKSSCQLSHSRSFAAFLHLPPLEHLVNFFFESIPFIVVVNFIQLRVLEAQLTGTVFPLFGQVVSHKVQVYIRNGCSTIWRWKNKNGMYVEVFQ